MQFDPIWQQILKYLKTSIKCEEVDDRQPYFLYRWRFIILSKTKRGNITNENNDFALNNFLPIAQTTFYIFSEQFKKKHSRFPNYGTNFMINIFLSFCFVNYYTLNAAEIYLLP